MALVVTYLLTGLWAESYEIWQSAKDTCEPVIDWIALGLKGNGSYLDNLDYIHVASVLPSKAEKVRYTKAYIWENRNQFFDVTHLIQKCRFNFASGHLGTKDYTYYSMKPGNVIWELFSPWGKHYWRISQITFCYLFAVYTVYFLGALRTAVEALRRKEIPVMKMVADVSLLGIIVFLMIWEANNRQLYNQMPVILLGGVMNIRRTFFPPSRLYSQEPQAM